jgi:hypothetical protein
LEGARTQLLQSDELTLDPLIPPFTREAAASGCHDRWEAANVAADAADDASAALRQWPEQARARQIRVPGVDALTAVTLAYYGNGSALRPIAYALASKHLDAMSPADRTAFEKLVADASSTTEAEYLWKAASAGYSLGQLESFDVVIHPCGNDVEWLEQHLDPGIVTFSPVLGRTPPQKYFGLAAGSATTFTQGQDPTCVLASTVMARLAADPVLMLGVTTGKGPAAVGGSKAGDDSQAAVAARAQTLFNQYYAYGRAVDDPKFLGLIPDQGAEPPGILPDKGAIALDDRLLTPVTGSAYQYQPLNDAADRQAALPKIEAAAQAGEPVPIEVASSSAAHQMVIEDYQNGELEIYNPWGYTQWVPTQQFVDGQLRAVTEVDGSHGLPDPTGVALPQQ